MGSSSPGEGCIMRRARCADAAQKFAPPRGATLSRGWSSISWMMRLPITTASATRQWRFGRCRIADAEAHAHRNFHMLADARQHLARRRGIQCAGTGHALERHVVDIAAGHARHLLPCARRCWWAPAGRSGPCPCAQFGGKVFAFFGRVVDDQHAIHACGGRIAHERARRHASGRSAPPGWHSPSAPRAWLAFRWRNSRTMSSTWAGRCPAPGPSRRPSG
jgi:hypothetical protein